MKKLYIGDRAVGPGEPVYIVAEAGRNHNGDMEMAEGLVKAAAWAGADAVKFQSFRARELMVKDIFKLTHEEHTTQAQESAYQATEKVELCEEAHYRLAEVARREGVAFLSTPEDMEMVEVLERAGVPAFKTASVDLTYLDLLRAISAKGRPMIVSTGMATMDEVAGAIDAIASTGNDQVCLLHCVSCYPPPVEDTNLRAMEALRQAFPFPVGYSDHSLGITIPIAAVALGACLIEKHFTLDRGLPGSDHRISADPAELRAMVEGIRTVERALGDGVKVPAPSEMDMRCARRKIVARRDIESGTTLSIDMLAVKMCRDRGIEPRFLPVVVGRETRASLREDEVITWHKIEGTPYW